MQQKHTPRGDNRTDIPNIMGVRQVLVTGKYLGGGGPILGREKQKFNL